MPLPALHRFEQDGHRYVIDPETCFCFECDAISWDVLTLYPQTPVNRIYHLLQEQHSLKELQEVVSELEWLRAAKSILPPPRDYSGELQVDRGLRELVVELPAGTAAPRRWGRKTAGPAWSLDIARAAAGLLLARSQRQEQLVLEYRLHAPPPDANALAALLEEGMRQGRLAGKQLTVNLHLMDLHLHGLPEALTRHDLSLRVPCIAQDPGACCRQLAGWWGTSFSKVAKAAAAWGGEEPVEAVVQVRAPDFKEVVAALDQAGFRAMRIDADALYTRSPRAAGDAQEVPAPAMLESLQENARYYVGRLLQQQYSRVEPFAGLFLRIHNGQPQLRQDPAGTQAMALDASGDLYPSPSFMGLKEYCLGSLAGAFVDEAQVRRFDDVGALTTPGCLRCWARSLCGGGPVAVHQALSGNFRRPDAAWCAGQREWLAASIAAFNELAAAGVNFSRIYQHLHQGKRPSLFTVARAAFRMQLGVRAPEESDADWLRRWENWNEAAYFTCTGTSVLMATQYDREMDALHPRGAEQELVIVRRDGAPMGLVRVRPERLPAAASLWVYLRNESDYTASAVRRSLQTILQEAAAQQSLQRLITPAGPREDALAAFLEGLGFQCAGIQREALYLHGHYHDVRLFSLDLAKL